MTNRRTTETNRRIEAIETQLTHLRNDAALDDYKDDALRSIKQIVANALASNDQDAINRVAAAEDQIVSADTKRKVDNAVRQLQQAQQPAPAPTAPTQATQPAPVPAPAPTVPAPAPVAAPHPTGAARFTPPAPPSGEPTNADLMAVLAGIPPVLNDHADLLDNHESRIRNLERNGVGGFNFLGAIIGAIIGFVLMWVIATIIWDLTGAQQWIISLVSAGVGAVLGTFAPHYNRNQ